MIQPNFFFLFYLSMLSMIGFLATDMYLPVFEKIEQDFQVNADFTSFSLSIFIFGLAIGQILSGFLAEKKGDKNVLSLGLMVFCVSSCVLFITDNSYLFLLARLTQGIGAAAPTAIWQAIAIKNFSSEQSKAIFRKVMPLVALSPALAPIFGSCIAGISSWQYIFCLLAAISLVLLFFTNKKLNKPTNNTEHNQPSISFMHLLKNRDYMQYVTIYSLCSALFFAFLTGWSNIMTEFGNDEFAIGLSFITQTICFIAGGFSLKYLTKKTSETRVLKHLLSSIFIALIFLFGF